MKIYNELRQTERLAQDIRIESLAVRIRAKRFRSLLLARHQAKDWGQLIAEAVITH